MDGCSYTSGKARHFCLRPNIYVSHAYLTTELLSWISGWNSQNVKLIPRRHMYYRSPELWKLDSSLYSSP
jgi:hypothetical protein